MNEPSEQNQEGSSGYPQCVVMKFGGTSVEDAQAIRRACDLVLRRSQENPVLVVSALARVTDQLMNAGWEAAGGQLDSARASVRELLERHQEVARGLAEGEACNRLCRELAEDLEPTGKVLGGIAADKAFTPQAQDRLLGVGEQLSSRLVHAALLAAGANTSMVDAGQCIVTDAAHTRATPLWEETNERLRTALLPLLRAGCVAVIGGFVGATRDGIPTTLGRGGSDFSAAIVGAGLQARRIEIWTDVDGVMTTDPQICPDARRVARMSFDEAADLAYFGAKVLHPATLVPAMRSNIPVWVRNSRNPECPGTEIVAHSADSGAVKAVTLKRGVAIVDVQPVRWFAPELLREVFDVFERHQHSLDLLSASRGSLALLVSSVSALPAIAEELKGLAHVRWENHKALVCLVGEQIRRRPELASQAFRAIGDVEVRMICQGASERNISFLVDEACAVESVQRLHRAFFSEARPAPEPRAASVAMCQAGEAWQ